MQTVSNNAVLVLFGCMCWNVLVGCGEFISFLIYLQHCAVVQVFTWQRTLKINSDSPEMSHFPSFFYILLLHLGQV